jgi:hypothetical protein
MKINPANTKIIACATIIEEVLPLMPPDMRYKKLEYGLHIHAEDLKKTLQEEINASAGEVENIILGYGLCSMAVVGLKSDNCTLIVPRVDDCIALFLGSQDGYKAQHKLEPGTYYLSKGWIEVGGTPFDEHMKLIEKHGEKKAARMMELMFRDYKRLALIITGQGDMERYRNYVKEKAQFYNMRYEEIPGSNTLIKKMLNGQMDDDFVIAPPGTPIKYSDFRRSLQSL